MLITFFIFHRQIKNIFIKLHLREDFYFILIMSYLLYQNNNLVGGFDELNKAKDMAQGILNNGWAKDFSIVKYKKNSCIKEDTIIINNNDAPHNTTIQYFLTGVRFRFDSYNDISNLIQICKI